MTQGPTGISLDVLQSYSNSSCNESLLQLQQHLATTGAQLEPGLMLAVTLWYLASGSMFTNIQWGFRLGPNTISEVVQEVSQAIVDAFWEEFIVTPSTEAQWHVVTDALHHHVLGAQPEPFPGDTADIPFFFIGVDTFALKEFLMKPYGHWNLTREERIFNYRLLRARHVVEHAFGIMSMCF